MAKTKTAWRSMGSAPTDGTLILVAETANGETFRVLPAAFMNHGGGNAHFKEKLIGNIGWWAIAPSRRTADGGNCPLPVRWQALASTPVCWMPLPEMEPEPTLLARLRQLFSKKTIERKEQIIEHYKNLA